MTISTMATISWRDAAGAAVQMQAPRLGEDLARVVALRANGAELKAIAADQQVAISTAHQRLATAVERIKRHTRRRGIAPTSLEPILSALSG